MKRIAQHFSCYAQRFCKKMGNKISELINALKGINWGLEIVKTIITTALVSLFTVSFLFLIKVNSPGDYTGARLESDLCMQLKKEIYCEPEISDFRYIYIGELSDADDKKFLITTGSYSSSESNQYGRFICVFAPKSHNLLNELLGTSPRYEIEFLRILPLDEIGYYSVLIYDSIETLDLDGDYYKEFVISFYSRYATRTSQASTLLCWTDNGWKCRTLDLKGVENIIIVEHNDYTALYDNHILCDSNGNKTEDCVIGLAYNGGIFQLTEPFWNIPCFLYKIPITDFSEGVMLTNEYVYVMAVFDNGEFHISNNWNNMMPLLSIDTKDNISSEYINRLWGLDVGYGSYYGLP